MPYNTHHENLYPCGLFSGWFYSKEIESAIKNDSSYKIIIKEIIRFKPNYSSISSYMSSIYRKRVFYLDLIAKTTSEADKLQFDAIQQI